MFTFVLIAQASQVHKASQDLTGGLHTAQSPVIEQDSLHILMRSCTLSSGGLIHCTGGMPFKARSLCVGSGASLARVNVLLCFLYWSQNIIS